MRWKLLPNKCQNRYGRGYTVSLCDTIEYAYIDVYMNVSNLHTLNTLNSGPWFKLLSTSRLPPAFSTTDAVAWPAMQDWPGVLVCYTRLKF